jgi:hypothetical protein
MVANGFNRILYLWAKILNEKTNKFLLKKSAEKTPSAL